MKFGMFYHRNHLKYARIFNKNYQTTKIRGSSRKCSSKPVLDTAYKPAVVEERHQLKVNEPPPTLSPKGRFTMILPPPNVTGYIHLGHCLTATVQDVIARHRRSQGLEVTWIPGTDHAGIATQMVVEKVLQKERGLNRHSIGREKFLEEVWRWKEQRSSKTKDDLLRLGTTLNWNLEYFTMNERHSHAVREAFIRLFNKGLIYRKEALVNWSCTLESAISDIEVDNIEISSPQGVAVPGYKNRVTFGQIYDIAYRTEGGDEIIVATTRPETLLGDTAIAVHPNDERYSQLLVNRSHFQHPFRDDLIPIVADESVDPNFGTGAVKITPAHDQNDYSIGQRHKLKSITVIDTKGMVLPDFKGFKGLPRFIAREKIIHELKQRGLLKGIRPHAMSIPICSRSKDVIEFLLRPQWFVSCKQMSMKALDAVHSGKIKLQPENFHQEWDRWLSNCHDWCISRQLWWGHRIPAFECVNQETGELTWKVAQNVKELQLSDEWQIRQDEDVLDTWFSSALLPFSLFGWPDADPRPSYPLNLMETGHDIIFFWVARMVMLGLELTGEVPFREVLLHGIICDAHGRKMSKSLGNVISPEQVIKGILLEELQQEAKQSAISGILSKDELERSIKECHTNKLFFNKIWQATRYTLNFSEKLGLESLPRLLDNGSLSPFDRWILSRLGQTQKTVQESLNEYNFHLATAAIKSFFYQNLCDVYLETTKRNQAAGSSEGLINCQVLTTCLSIGLNLICPFTPHLTAELRQFVPKITFDSTSLIDSELEIEIDQLLEVCAAVRQLKSQNSVTKKHNPVLVFNTTTEEGRNLLEKYEPDIEALTFSSRVLINPREESLPKLPSVISSTAGADYSFTVYSDKNVETASVKQINTKKFTKLQGELEKLMKRINSAGYRESANEQVQKRHSERIKAIQSEMETIKAI